MESVNNDDDKTNSIKPKRLRVGFNSGEYDVDGSDQVIDVSNFSDGGESRWLVRILTGSIALPFLGNLVLDDNSEAFQPRPNPVQLIASEGLNSLRDVELRTLAGELPIGHYSIADYLAMCLNNLIPGQQMRVIMNLYEVDSDETTSHTFSDIFLDALTFEKEVDSREDCLTVLTKILDAFGCFITYDHDGWWIIRWDEYDAMGTSILTHRAAVFDANDGSFQTYELIDLTKVIAADYAAEYEGYRLSHDNAIRRFQRKAKEVVHTYNFSLPKEIPCNVKFTRGTILMTTVSPTESHYEVDCWTYYKFGANNPNPDTGSTSPDSDAYIAKILDANGYQTENYLVLPFDADQHAIISQPIQVSEKDKINVSVNYRWSANKTGGGSITIDIFQVLLAGDSGNNYTLDDDGTWFQSDASWVTNYKIIQGIWVPDDVDETVWRDFSVESNEIPEAGNIYIVLDNTGSLGSSVDDVDAHFNDLTVDYIPYINGGYGEYEGQEVRVSADNGSRRIIEKEMFIGEPPIRMAKGGLKKFDGSNYVLTEGWNDFITPAVFTDERLSKFIVYQWWNQYRKTRTVIETDIQGINSDQEFGIPGLIYRWKISHANEGDKFFMLTSLRDLNFRTCGWAGVFVETSDFDGDRVYTDDFEFKFIQ